MVNIGTIPLETERLILRRFSIDDGLEIFEGYRNQYEFLYYANKNALSIEETIDEISEILKKYSQNDYYNWVITLKNSNKIIGSINLKYNEKFEGMIFSYAIDNRFTNNGYMTEALNSIKSFCFNNLQVNQIIGGCIESNLPSRRVMEKCGLEYKYSIENFIYLTDGYHNSDFYFLTNKNN